MTIRRVLVTGGRDYTDREKVWAELNKLAKKYDIILIHGDNPKGADRFAREWAEENLPVDHHKPRPANWKRYGNSAGPIRNRQMLLKDFPDEVLAFGGLSGRGTNHMVYIAKQAGVPVKEFDRDQ